MPKFISPNQKSKKQISGNANLNITVSYLKSVITESPEILLVLGSGLGSFAESVKNPLTIPYETIPFFKTSTAPGHAGRLVYGKINEKKVLIMQGRFHVYEGYTPMESAYPVLTAAKLGINTLITSCACGGINSNYSVGDMVAINDHINFLHTSPLVGFNHSEYGERFIDMSNAYDKELILLAKKAADDSNVLLNEGVYFYMPGPQFETPSEIRAIKKLGADLVGMSLVHETVMARRCGIKVLAFGLVTNLASGISEIALSEKDVLDAGNKSQTKFSNLINAVLTQM